jgi:hypothetical protein
MDASPTRIAAIESELDELQDRVSLRVAELESLPPQSRQAEPLRRKISADLDRAIVLMDLLMELMAEPAAGRLLN